MNKKLIQLMVALAWLALTALVQAQFTFTTNNGAITITGYNTAAGLDAVIPAMTNGHPVSSIGDYAFQSSGITNVTIPNSVTSIGAYAFFECASLTNVTILNSVTSIGDAAFASCTSLTSINVDAANPAYSSMNGVLFDKAKATLLQFPGGLGGSYTIPINVTSIGQYAFENCTSLTSVTIPNSVTSIGQYAFAGTSLTSVTIPNSVTNIGDSAFEDCTRLTSVTIPDSVTSIGDAAFFSSGLTSVTIPNGVTTIGFQAFEFCYSLTSINVDATSPAYSSMDGVLFDKTQATLLQFPGGLGGSYTIPNSVTSIGAVAFAICTSLTSVTIPNSVSSIGTYAFYDCTSLTTAYFLGNAPPDHRNAFYLDPATVYYLAGTTGWGSYFGGAPAMLWNPQANTFSFTGGQFGFNLTGPAYAVIVVEACTNLSHPVWLPVSTNTLSGAGTSAFSDPTDYPMRFYRLRSP